MWSMAWRTSRGQPLTARATWSRRPGRGSAALPRLRTAPRIGGLSPPQTTLITNAPRSLSTQARMAFTGAEKIQIRRFCGYPVFGNSPGTGLGYRFLPYYEALEWKMNHLCAEEERLVREMYLPRLAQLETDLFDQTRENLDTDAATGWTHNQAEHRDRAALFDDLRRRFCGYLGVPPGPDLGQGGIRVMV